MLIRLVLCFQFDQVVVINAFGKRLDQTIATIETLFHITKITDKPIYLMSEESIACLLLPVWVLICNCYAEGLETDNMSDLLTNESMLSL